MKGMLRSILATAILVLAFAGGALAVYFQVHKEELTPIGRRLALVSFLGLLWTGLPLGAALWATYAPPGNRWQRCWRFVAGATCFYAVIGLFALAVNQLLQPLVGETIGQLIYFGVSGICVHLCLKRFKRPK
jgi:hypothetical protein